MITSRLIPKIAYYQKYLGILLIIIGLPLIFIDSGTGAEMPLMTGLFIIYISKEKIEDERSVNLKVTSLYFSFFLGYALKLITSNLFSNGVIGWELVEINHFIIFIFAIALITYYVRLHLLK